MGRIRKRVETSLLSVTTLSLLSTIVVSCSLLLDVEPDCDAVSDCTPYVCNSENTACLSDCAGTSDCAPGFVCERGGTSCVSQGCQPLTDAVSLLSQGGSGFEYDVALLDGTFWVVAASSGGVGLTDVALDGSTSGSLITLDTDPVLPVTPVAASSANALHILWHGEPSRNQEDVRYFRLNSDNSHDGPRVIFTGQSGQNVDNLTGTTLGTQVLVTWATFLVRSQVQLLVLEDDGTVVGDPVTITNDSTGSSLPAIASTADAAGFARRETSSGENIIVASMLDQDLVPVSDLPLSERTTSLQESVAVAGMNAEIAVVWIETQEDGRVLYRAVLGEEGVVRVGTVSQDTTDDPVIADVAAGVDEFAVLWVAEENRVPEVFMRRFDRTGNGIFLTFPVADGNAISPGVPRIVRTDDGYGVFWVEFGFDAPELFFRRYLCVR